MVYEANSLNYGDFDEAVNKNVIKKKWLPAKV